MDGATAALESSGLAQRSLAVGALAPDFALPDATGRRVALTSLLAEGPVVLSFYRGGWCPYCSTQLRALQTRLADIAEAGGRLVAVSPQTPDHSLSTAEKLELAFPVLSDVGNIVARTYGLVFSLPEDLREVYAGFGLDLPAANGDDTFELPMPATFVVGTDGKVTWRFVDSDYTRRAEPDDVIDALRSL
ncbi:MAG: AhpC/TSA family protein [Acidobacteriota bacterium]|nr:AhpC/TSA family protein [Acidobacteriota bacterium]